MTTVEADERPATLRREGHVAVITLNRPRAMNAINAAMSLAVEDAINELADDPQLRVGVLTGAGRAFCAGADLKAVAAGEPLIAREQRARGFGGFLQEYFDKPLIAAVNGYALGGGMEIAMACDFIVASEGAKLGQPEVLLGVIPGFAGTQRLSRLVGAHWAKRLCMTGEHLMASEAHRIGLVTEVAAPDQLLARCEALLAKTRENGPLAVRLAKDVINRGTNMDLEAAAALEAEAFALCFSTQDQKEGMRAFLEKRKPQFRGS